jgi:DUF1680 family protein
MRRQDDSQLRGLTRREALTTVGRTTAFALIATPVVRAFGSALSIDTQALPLATVAGIDRVVMLTGKTYLSAWAGYGAPPRRGRGAGAGAGTGRGNAADAAAAPLPPPGPPPATKWSKVSGPGDVRFADASAPVTTATFSKPGDYVLSVTADNGTAKATSNLTVKVELPPPAAPLAPVFTTSYSLNSPFWSSRVKALIVNWIPHCIDQCNRTDLVQGSGSGAGGIDNFIEAGKALRGEPHGKHKGYVFSNAWVHQTVESICLSLMIDPQGDKEIIDAQTRMKATLEDWIPKILAAQHPDGYLQTAFTLRDALAEGETYPAGGRGPWLTRWSPTHRGNHEGYVAGYFIESAINHYMMTGRKDVRLYNAAKKLADCWADNIGPSSAKAPDGKPKQAWFDGHQEMEQALVRFGRFVNEIEGPRGPGDRYIALAKFLLDCRASGSEYDQSHLPVTQQYEAVGHAVRAVYTYSGMADVAVETRDVDYQSAVKSIWDNIVHRKYYLTGGVGSGESSEGFGPNYSLRQNAYCETCSSCGEIFFQWKLHLAYHDAQYADLYEETIYNALIGSLALDGKNYYYDNPLDSRVNRYAWHSVPCCVGNLPRTTLMLPTWMYSRGRDGLYVNMFAGSRVHVEGVAGTNVDMIQDTNYPFDGKVTITVNPSARTSFAIRVRVPNRDVSSLYTSAPVVQGLNALAVNGRRVTPQIVNGYAVITRAWTKGDTISFEVPMAVQRVHASDKIEATKGKVALRYGPMVYNIEKVDHDITKPLARGSRLAVEFRKDLLGGVPVITGSFADGTPLLAIPNFARMNRNPPPPPRPPQPAAPATPPAAGAPRPAPPPPASIVWIDEG